MAISAKYALCDVVSPTQTRKTTQGDLHVGVIAQANGTRICGLSSCQDVARGRFASKKRHMQPAWRPLRVPSCNFVEGELRLSGERAGHAEHCYGEIKVEAHGGVSICSLLRQSCNRLHPVDEGKQSGRANMRGKDK